MASPGAGRHLALKAPQVPGPLGTTTLERPKMMLRPMPDYLLPGAIGIAFWLLVCGLSETREPWDAERYWTLAYPGSVLLAALIGFWSDRRGWRVGLVLTLAQFPVMLMLSGIGSMSLFALLLLGVLAVPVMLASAAASGMGRRFRRR